MQAALLYYFYELCGGRRRLAVAHQIEALSVGKQQLQIQL